MTMKTAVLKPGVMKPLVRKPVVMRSSRLALAVLGGITLLIGCSCARQDDVSQECPKGQQCPARPQGIRGPLMVDDMTIGVPGFAPAINGAFTPTLSTPKVPASKVLPALATQPISDIVQLLGPGEIFISPHTKALNLVWAIDDGGLLFAQGPFQSKSDHPAGMTKVDAGRNVVW